MRKASRLGAANARAGHGCGTAGRTPGDSAGHYDGVVVRVRRRQISERARIVGVVANGKEIPGSNSVQR